MGWKQLSNARVSNEMSPAQRSEITCLREQHDGVARGTYAADKLPGHTKSEASRIIDDLKARVERRQPKQPMKCPFCMTATPCGCARSRG